MEETALHYLTEILNCHYKSGCRVHSVELLDGEKGRRPIYIILASYNNRTTPLILHFRPRPPRNEIQALQRAQHQGVFVPRIFYCQHDSENPFRAPFKIGEFVQGKKLRDEPEWMESHFDILVEALGRIHLPAPGHGPTSSLANLQRYQAECRDLLKHTPLIDVTLLMHRFEQVSAYYDAHKQLFAVSWQSLLHGDLHPTNILVTEDDQLCFLDWELASEGDYCSDLAYFRSRALDFMELDAGEIYKRLLHHYKEAFQDESLEYRMCFHLAERYLEYIWRSSWPKISEKWLRFFFDKLNRFMDEETGELFRI